MTAMLMDYKIVDSISKIKRSDWDDLFGAQPEGYEFYLALEQSGFKEFSFYYVLLYDRSTLYCVAPVFLHDFPVDAVLDPRFAKAVAALRKLFPRLLVFRTLFCGSPFGEHGVIGIKQTHRHDPRVPIRLAQALGIFAHELRASLIIFKDFRAEDAAVLDGLCAAGFFKTDSFPSAVVDLSAASFDEYLAGLGHATRKSLRRKLKKSRSEGALRTEVVSTVDAVLDEVYELYLQTYHAGATKFEKLTKDFFQIVARCLGAQCIYFLYYVHDTLAAFNLCFWYGDVLIDKFIGFDYRVSRRHNLYAVSWCTAVSWCLEHGVRRYQVGQTDYAPKIQLGARLVPLYAYVRHTRSGMNVFFKLLARLLNAPTHQTGA